MPHHTYTTPTPHRTITSPHPKTALPTADAAGRAEAAAAVKADLDMTEEHPALECLGWLAATVTFALIVWLLG